MAVPGFSLSELARAIKNAYEISQELKDAPKELESIVEGVQFGRSFLEELRRHVPKGNEKLYEESHPLLVHVYREYDLILKKLDTFIRKHGKLAGGGLRARVKWVVDKHLVETCEDLKSKLRAVEQRGTLALSLSNYDISRETKTRNDSIVSPAHPAYITQLSHSPELLPQDSAASQSRNPLTPVTPIRIRNGSALLNDSQDLSPISPNEPNPSSGHYDNASPSRTNSSPNWPESPRSNTTNEQFQNTYNITADIVAVTGRNAAQQWPTRTVRASTASTAVTVTPSVFSVPSNRSSVSTVDMTQEFMSPISPTQLQTKRSPSTESSPIPGRQSRSNTFLSGGGSSTPRALVAVDKNPPSGPASEHSILISQNTSCRINVLLEGEVKVCYTAGRERTWKTVTSIDIERSNTGSDLKICLKTKDGIDRIHRAAENVDLAASILLHHGGFIPKYVRKADASIRYHITFIGDHYICRARGHNLNMNSSPEYSFSNGKDCEVFQSRITGKELIFSAEVDEICFGKNVNESLSDGQVLQIWSNNSIRSMRFFANDKEDGEGGFCEFNTVGLEQCDIKKTKALEVRLVFRDGYDTSHFRKLKITFTADESESKKKNVGQRSTKSSGKEPEQESVRDRFIRLARFGAT